MFGEKERSLKIVEGETLTLLDRDAQFEGKLTFEGKVQINGKFRGEIFSEGTLVIGEGAVVDAKIEIDTVIIQGQVNGSIQAKSRIEMHPPAVVKGDIASPGLVISDGALFGGSCSMGRDQAGVFQESDNVEAEVVGPEASIQAQVQAETKQEIEPETEAQFEPEAEPEHRAQQADSLF